MGAKEQPTSLRIFNCAQILNKANACHASTNQSMVKEPCFDVLRPLRNYQGEGATNKGRHAFAHAANAAETNVPAVVSAIGVPNATQQVA